MELLMNTSKSQGVSLLKNITDDQVVVMTEIVVNFFNDNLPGPVDRLRPYKNILREVGHNPKRTRVNKRIIVKHALQWYNIVCLLKPGLSKILS